MSDIIIGSGPAGVSVAKALLARGRKVILIDGGKLLEPERVATRDALAAIPPARWSAQARAAYQAPQFETPEGQARKYGSDFAMEPASATLNGAADWFGLRASHAVGGLSNLWGTAVLPYAEKDMVNWPIDAEDLAPHYRSVADFMPVNGGNGAGLGMVSETSHDRHTVLKNAPQAREILERLQIGASRLASLGVRAGAAQVAVDTGCQSCGMCLHGCPWQYMYSSDRTVRELLSNPNFDHRPGSIARSFGEDGNGVMVQLNGGGTISGQRLFVAAGALETARLIMASLPGKRELTLMDSQHAFVPMLHRWHPPVRPDRMPFTTLPQIFLEIDSPQVSPHMVHAQVYTWTEFFAHDLIKNYGFGIAPMKPILRALARRLIVAQVFLHSDHSARIRLRLEKNGTLAAALEENRETSDILLRARKRISRAMSTAGLTTLGFASRPGGPGSSFHVGGTVPMAKDPVDGQSDRLGRPKGLDRIHLVDASVLPAIPATTITYSVMANAHRIGTEAP